MDENRRIVFDKSASPYDRLKAIMAVLRSENGCAWDRKQTHKSLLPYLIEETYEVIETIEQNDLVSLKEELGDLACQIAFHAQLASEAGHFDMDDSLICIIDKLIRRHPHVFGDKENDLTPDQVRNQWEKIKVDSGEKKSVLSGIPASMPALNMAFRMGEKAAGVGFDWKKASDVLAKINEELAELIVEIDAGQKDKAEEEIGDLLFAVASLSRKLDINPEQALRSALVKFRNRFEEIEAIVKKSGKKFDQFSLEELEEIWQKVK